MLLNPGELIDFLNRNPPELEETPTPEPPGYLFGNQRTLKKVKAPRLDEAEQLDLPAFRRRISEAMRDYMLTPNPEHMLLIPAPPGSGKTWAGVNFAHWVYAQMNRRTLYAGPRHDFFADVTLAAEEQGHDRNLWYEWLPRQRDDEIESRHTCNWADEITIWLNKGYRGIKFCPQSCGWDYVNNGCPYHAQKKRSEPLIYGQHAHLVMGHPLSEQFVAVIGDELPLTSFVHEWQIGTKHIHWADLPMDEPLTALLFDLQKLCREGNRLHGPDLINALTMGAILKSCKDFAIPATAEILEPTLHRWNIRVDTENAPVNFLSTFVPMLYAEALAMQTGEDYLHRLWTDSDGLTILARRYVDPHLPNHVIWFDATGTPDIYTAIFGRKVEVIDAVPRLAGRIYQVTDRANGKSSLFKYDKESKTHEPTNKVEQLKLQINRICERENATKPAVITFLDLADKLEQDASHFYGARGTNQFQDCDVLIVAGTPQPPLYQIEKLAKALWPDRMRPFDSGWYSVDRTYNYIDANGDGWSYPVGIFADYELSALLWQFREAEIIQAAHRSRILFHNTPVYLLTNIAIEQLPPNELMSIQELMGVPQGINVFKWDEIVAFADEHGEVGTNDLIEQFKFDPRTARKYVMLLAEQPGWEPRAIRNGPGRPQSAAGRIE